MSDNTPKTLEDEVLALQQVPMWQGIDPRRLKLLAFTSERLSFEEGQVLFTQGDPSDSAYVILAGAADVMVNTGEDAVKVARIGQFHMIGEMGLLTNGSRSATVIAAEPTVVLRIDKDVFFELMRQFPQMTLAVMVELAKRLERSNARLSAVRSDERNRQPSENAG